jgi:ubiquinone/menaquinone biosynthesis C-methylase UbiE
MVAWLCEGCHLHVLDAGCGEGSVTRLFAHMGCTVTGVDIDTPSLDRARQLAESSPFASRMTYVKSDLTNMDTEVGQFDLIWCSYVLHHIADKANAVKHLKRVLKPGGRLAIREDGLPIQFFPFDMGIGEPGLQDRLRVANNRWFAAMTRATLSDAVSYPHGWLQLLYDQSFSPVAARTFTLDALSPLDAAHEQFIVYYLQRTLERDDGEYGPLLSTDDKAVLQQLLDQKCEHYVLKRNDLHLRYGLSVYVGTK